MKYNSFIGLESPYIIGTAVIGAQKGCGWLKDFFKRYENPNRHLISITGVPNFITNTLEITDYIGRQFPNRVDVEIFDVDYFCGKLYFQNGMMYTSENTVAIHHFEGTWVGHKNFFKSLIYRMFLMYARLKK